MKPKEEINQYVISKLPKFMFTDTSNSYEIDGQTKVILKKIRDSHLSLKYHEFENEPHLDWEGMPDMVNPVQGHLKPARALRKRYLILL